MKQYIKQLNLNPPLTPRLATLLLALGIVVLYGLVVVPLYHLFGPGSVAFICAPAIAVAWLLGLHGGVFSMLLLLELTRLLLHQAGVPVDALVQERLPGAISLLLLVVAAGALRDYVRQLQLRSRRLVRERALLQEQLAATRLGPQQRVEELEGLLSAERAAGLRRSQALLEQLAAARATAQEYEQELRTLLANAQQRSQDLLMLQQRVEELEEQLGRAQGQLAAEAQVSLQGQRAAGDTQLPIVPICASCKKVHDGAGCWTEPELYLHSALGLRFSHGVCPDCTRNLYPHLYAAGPAADDLLSRVMHPLAESSHRADLIASALWAWLEQHQADLTALAGFLGCSVEALVLLAACTRPQPGRHRDEDLELIAACVDADPGALAQLLAESEMRL